MASADSPTLDDDVGSIAPWIVEEEVVAMVCVDSAAEIAGLALPQIFHVFCRLKFVRTLITNSPITGCCSRGPHRRSNRRGVPKMFPASRFVIATLRRSSLAWANFTGTEFTGTHRWDFAAHRTSVGQPPIGALSHWCARHWDNAFVPVSPSGPSEPIFTSGTHRDSLIPLVPAKRTPLVGLTGIAPSH